MNGIMLTLATALAAGPSGYVNGTGSYDVSASPRLDGATACWTRETAAWMCTEWGEPLECVQIQEDAYLASDRAWLNWINAWDDRHESGWIVGHNPGLSELVERLTEQPVWLPTCGLAEVELQVESWAEAFAGTGRLRGLFTPKSSLCP